MIWVFIICELLGFGIGQVMFAYQKHLDPDTFIASKQMLNPLYGTFNTVILITSGFFVAMASSVNHRNYQGKNTNKVVKYWSIATLLGVCFLILKFAEYYEKSTQGIFLGHNTFFDFYFLLTMFHALHVLGGILILSILIFKTIKETPYPEEDLTFETGCMFWHMCDIIWVIVFPFI